jgi:putative two-component system response regulator
MTNPANSTAAFSDSVSRNLSATLLLVDDTPDNLTILAEILEAEHRILAATTGQRALAIARTTPHPDLILLDITMPGMDGYAVIRELKADAATRDIPVIFVTALDATENEEYGLGLGAADYITKPVKPSIVLARVRTQLEVKRARDWLRNQNAFLDGEVRRRMAENQMVQDVSMHALAHLAETRDPETGNHLRRTREYVRLLATRLQQHPDYAEYLAGEIDLLAKSAVLHDIGKVGIPDSVLLKPGKLTAEEWVIMQTHAALGAVAIEQAERDVERPVEFLAMAKQIARWHHEKWDGTGYPDRLAGEQIPIPARIMALADVFDALISPRVYKPDMSYEKAREIIVDGRGQHFAPDVVDAFIADYAAFIAIAERYRDAACAHAAAQRGLTTGT